MPRAMPRSHHSIPFRIQHANVIAIISGMAFWVLCALSLNSSSLPIRPPVKRFRSRVFAILVNMFRAFFDHVKRANTVAPSSISPMPKPASSMPAFMPAIVCGNMSFQIVVGTYLTRYITAPMPPATFIKNSIVCMPKMVERAFGAGTFWSFK